MFKTSLVRIINYFIESLKSLKLYLEIGDKEILPYHSLSPIDTANIKQDYAKALAWAIENRKKADIKNIAITGPYGSGKSSILKTFQIQNKTKNIKFLNLSLAAFSESIKNQIEDVTNNEIQIKEDAKRNDLLRLVELSILQQIFYHEKDENIPDSRFKKIKKRNKYFNLILVLGGFIFLTSAFLIFFPVYFQNIFKINLEINYTIILYYIGLLILVSGLFYLLYKLIKIINTFSIKKFSINSTQIEIDKNISKSILNQYIDEIIYFFEATKCNVVIIEDLDRFEQTNIFTKLREINFLINNSKKVSEVVVFVYAVRDDLFIDRERFKFFDFIIPVIPVVNSSNAKEILLSKVKDNSYKISITLIEDISLFIDDMRLIHNIINEFHLYYIKLQFELNEDKLLAMIVYKNIFPSDFVKLSNNEGLLFSILKNKFKYVENIITNINNKIEFIKGEIKSLENLRIKDINELTSIYLLKIVDKLHYFRKFSINNKSYTVEQVKSPDLFSFLVNNQAKYEHNRDYSPGLVHKEAYNTTTIPFTFNLIEQDVDPKYSYLERKKQIEDWNDKKIDVLKSDISNLEKEKDEINILKIKDLIDNTIFDNNTHPLLKILLISGYIDEDYLDYISIFYEGSISRSDNQFVINVKSQKVTEFNYKLNKIENLIKLIDLPDFSKPTILNYDLIDYLLTNPNNSQQLSSIIKLLQGKSKESKEFIQGYIQLSGRKLDLLVKNLGKGWNTFWIYIEEIETLTEEKRNEIFNLMIQNLEKEDLLKISNKSPLEERLANNVGLIIHAKDRNKIKDLLLSLNRFSLKYIYEIEDDIDFFRFAYEKSLYEINIPNITSILKFYDTFDEIKFNTTNYQTINKSGCTHLIEYINQNIMEYINSVYLKIETNTSEPEDELLALIDRAKDNLDIIKLLVKKVDTKISDLSITPNTEIDKILIGEDKILPSWENILDNFTNEEDSFTEEMIKFINIKKNSKELGSIILPNEDDYNNLFRKLLIVDDINVNILENLIKSLSGSIDNLDINNISEDKVKLLVENNKIKTNAQNFSLIKNKYYQYSIAFIEKNIEEVIMNVSTYDFKANDIINMITSKRLSDINIFKFINLFSNSEIIKEVEVLNEIGKLMIKTNEYTINNEIIKLVLIKSTLPKLDKIYIYNTNYVLIDDHMDINDFIKSLGYPYATLNNNGSRPFFENNEINEKFMQVLKNASYISSYKILDNNRIQVFTFR